MEGESNEDKIAIERRDFLTAGGVVLGVSGLAQISEATTTIEDTMITSETQVTASGGTRRVTLSHSHGETPAIAVPIPASPDASTDHWVTAKGSSTVELTYPTDTPSGDGNLVYDLVLVGSTTDDGSTDDGSTDDGSTDDGSTDGSTDDSTVVVDDFESGDLSAYTLDTADCTIQSTVVAEGSNALEATDQYVEIYSTEGLNAYPSQGSVFRAQQFDRESPKDARVNFGVTDDRNQYEVRIYRNRLVLNRVVDDENVALASTPIEKAANEWYDVEVVWDDGSLGGSQGDITATLYDSGGSEVASVETNDTTYADGGIGWRAQSAGSVFDNYRIVG